MLHVTRPAWCWNINIYIHTHRIAGPESFLQLSLTENKLRWYPQQPQRFILTNISEACCEAKRWKHLSLLQSLPDLLRNLLRNPVEPDLPLHQALPDLLRNLLRNGSAPKPPGPSPEPSTEKTLNLTWLCTKASWNLLRNLLRNPVEPDLPLHQSLPNFSAPDLALHRSFPDLLRTLSGTFSGTFSEPCWTWPDSARKPPRPSPETFSATVLNLTMAALHQSLPGLLQNLLRNLLQNPVEADLALHQGFLEPSPEPCWTWPVSAPGTCGTFSGTSLKLTRHLHQCTPELFWAEDPISLRCWGKTQTQGDFRRGRSRIGKTQLCHMNPFPGPPQPPQWHSPPPHLPTSHLYDISIIWEA